MSVLVASDQHRRMVGQEKDPSTPKYEKAESDRSQLALMNERAKMKRRGLLEILSGFPRQRRIRCGGFAIPWPTSHNDVSVTDNIGDLDEG